MNSKIFIPNILDNEDLTFILEEINHYKKDGKIKEGDYVLVDELDGKINIKVLIGEAIENMAKKLKVEPKDILMIIMRDQNKANPEIIPLFNRHEIIEK
jgi:hypothetical protein